MVDNCAHCHCAPTITGGNRLRSWEAYCTDCTPDDERVMASTYDGVVDEWNYRQGRIAFRAKLADADTLVALARSQYQRGVVSRQGVN